MKPIEIVNRLPCPDCGGEFFALSFVYDPGGHVLENQKYWRSYKMLKCLNCGNGLTRGNINIDHLDPISKGGAHSLANLIACCVDCNMAKRAMDYIEWIGVLKDPYRTRAITLYKKKTGRFPEQSGFRFKYLTGPRSA